MTSIYILPVYRARCVSCDCDAVHRRVKGWTQPALWCKFHYEEQGDTDCPVCHRNVSTRSPDVSIG